MFPLLAHNKTEAHKNILGTEMNERSEDGEQYKE